MDNDTKAYLLISCIRYLAMVVQERLPYHVNGIDSNDTLYGGNEEFLNQVYEITSIVKDKLLEYLKELGDRKETKRQSAICLECIHHLAQCGDTYNVGKLILNLWKLSIKDSCDAKNCRLSTNYLRYLSKEYDDEALFLLCERMESLLVQNNIFCENSPK